MAVAFGAAVQAAILAKQVDASSPALSSLLLIDVTPLSLGIEISGGAFHRLIHRNSTLPTRKSHTFSTVSDQQRVVEIKIFEGERARAQDNAMLGVFELEDLPPMPRGQPVIEVTFSLDANGVLSVSAVEKSSGAASQIVISGNKQRLEQQQIDAMLKEAEQKRDDDSYLISAVSKRAQLMQYCCSLRHMLATTLAHLPADELQPIQSQVNDTIAWIDAQPPVTDAASSDTSQFDAKLESLQALASPLVSKLFSEDMQRLAKRQKRD